MTKINHMAKSNRTRNIVIGVVALVALYVIFVNPDILDEGIPTPAIVGTPVDDSGVTNLYEGPITVRFPASDAGDPSIAYGEDTELDIVLYRLNADGSYNRLTAPTSAEVGSATVTSSPDLKTIYAEHSIASSQAYYIDVSSTDDLNSRLAGAPQWLDLNNDGRPTYVFPIDISGFPTNPATTPQFDFTVELVDEGSLTVDSPADVNVTDTGKQRCNVKWSADMDNSGDGEVVTRIRGTFNSTDTNDWYTLDTNISFPTGDDPNSAKQKIFLSEFTPTELSSTYRYDYMIGNGDVKEGQLLLSPLNGETNFEIPVELWVNMDSQTALQMTLEIQTVDSAGTQTTSSDAVICY